MELEIIAVELNKCADRRELLLRLSSELVKKSYAREGLAEAVIEREKEFPTGLELKGGVNVAIPHADAKYILKPAILVARLKEPVIFQHMVDRKTIPVIAVFFLALKDPHSQISTLQKLASILEDESTALRLKSIKSSKELANFLRSVLRSD